MGQRAQRAQRAHVCVCVCVWPGTRLARAWQGPGKGPGKGLARACQGPGKGLARAWQGPGKGLARDTGYRGHRGYLRVCKGM